MVVVVALTVALVVLIAWAHERADRREQSRRSHPAYRDPTHVRVLPQAPPYDQDADA